MTPLPLRPHAKEHCSLPGPHAEEHREAMRLEAWAATRSPSFETPAFAALGGLLRMRAETAERFTKRPLPNPPPQAGEGEEKQEK